MIVVRVPDLSLLDKDQTRKVPQVRLGGLDKHPVTVTTLTGIVNII